TGEKVAFGLGGDPSFLNYTEQRLGINLGFKKSASYEWIIFGESGKKSEVVETGKLYALVNINVKPNPDFLIYLDREIPRTCDIGWTTSPNKLGKILNVAQAINNLRKEIL